MIRILHIIGSMNLGGVETWLMHVLRHIDRQSFRMDFCCLSGEPGMYGPEIESLGSSILPCKLTKNLISFNKRFKMLLQAGCYHVVHSHVHHFSGYILRRAANEDIPIRLAHSHTITDAKRTTVARRIYRSLQRRWINNYATAIMAASEKAGVSLYGEKWRADPRPQIVRCGIDVTPFSVGVDCTAMRKSLGIADQAKVIGHVGRFDRAKNHGFLLDIAKEVVKRGSDARLLLVGDGSLRPDIEHKIQQSNLQSYVVLVGWRSDVAKLMIGAMDFFCMPSLYEGLPVAAIEAQAAGLPCLISTDVTSEIDIVPGAVSFLPRSAGAAAWAEVICQKLKAGRMDAAEAIEAIRNKGFDVESSLKSLMRLYAPTETADGDSRYAACK